VGSTSPDVDATVFSQAIHGASGENSVPLRRGLPDRNVPAQVVLPLPLLSPPLRRPHHYLLVVALRLPGP